MKFKKLTIHNIASIGDAEIDFEHGPLAEDSRFLICGPTGAGKTTLLDTICLALYGTTPRLHATKNEGYVDPNETFTLSSKREEIKIDDTRMMMRRGCLNAWVELVFTDKDDCPLKAVWSCSRARNKADGSIKVPEWSVMDATNDVVLCAKKSEVASYIGERIGLTFEQFCRTTMLAQGDFTKFLKSGENEKSDILEKLTGTAIYSEISKCIHVIKGEKDAACQQVKSKLQGVQLLEKEEVETIQSERKELDVQAKKLASEEQQLMASLQWLVQLEKLKAEAERTKQVYNVQLAKSSAPEVKELEELLADWDRTAAQRELWNTLAQSEETLAAKREEAVKLRDEYVRLLAGLADLQQKEEKMRQAKRKVDQYLSDEASKAECYQQMGLIDSLVERRMKTLSYIHQVEVSLKSKESQLKGCDEDLKRQKKQTDDLFVQVQEKEKNLQALTLKLESLNYEGLLAARQDLNTQLTGLNEYRFLVEQCNQLHRLAQEKSEALRCVLGTVERFTSSLQEEEKKAKELELRVTEQEEVYKKQERACSDLMREYRKGLIEGESCPLCGQPVTHLIPDEHFVSILQPLKESLEGVRIQWKEASKCLAESKAQLATALRDQTLKERELATARDHEEQVVAQKKAHALNQRFESEELPLEAIDAAMNHLKQREEELGKQLQSVGELQKQKEALQHEKDALVKASQAAADEVKEIEKKQTRIQEGVVLDRQTLEMHSQNMKETETNLSTYIDWSLYVEQGEVYLQKLHTGAQYYQMAQDKQRRVDTTLQEFVSDLSHVRQSQTAIESLQSDWKSLKAEAASPMEQLPVHWVDFQSRVSVNKDNLQQLVNLKETASQALHRYFSEKEGVSEERLGRLAGLSSEEVKSLRESQQKMRDIVLRLKTEMDTAEQNLAKHQRVQPQGELSAEADELKSRLEVVKSNLGTINQKMGMFAQTLETDRQNRIRFESITKELDLVTQEADRWSHLHTLFGSADGKKFRNIAQSYVLEQLLANANQYLLQFSSRYEMVCQPGSLTILLKDNEAGGVLRPTSTISGGESFFISLSLALGLSSLSRASFSMDTLFIDEGFGTLDSTYLSAVMDALERLHQMGGKKIGIISHVESLKERLTTQIQVSRINNTLSKVEVVSLL